MTRMVRRITRREPLPEIEAEEEKEEAAVAAVADPAAGTEAAQ